MVSLPHVDEKQNKAHNSYIPMVTLSKIMTFRAIWESTPVFLSAHKKGQETARPGPFVSMHSIPFTDGKMGTGEGLSSQAFGFCFCS